MRIRTTLTFITKHPRIAGIILIILTGICSLTLFLTASRIPQWTNYHLFADNRTFLGIPNFWNVASNLLFFLVSIYGFWSLQQQWSNKKINKQEATVFFFIFLGLLLTGIGSSYYHLMPDNDRLVWDRIPMTMVFMSILSLTIMERINFNLGFNLLFPLMILGVCSVVYWHWTDDLRLYILIQFYTMFLIILILFFFPKPYPPFSTYFGLFIFYLLAKLLEYFDLIIYRLLDELLSGHTLKHVFSALSAYFLVIMLRAKDNKIGT